LKDDIIFSMFTSYKNAIKNYAEFKGRMTRHDFWMFFFADVLITGILFALIGGLGHAFASESGESVVATILAGIYFLYRLFMIIPAISANVRRLHDTDRSGWHLFLHFVPFVGPFIVLYFLVSKGDEEKNEYGDAPAIDAKKNKKESRGCLITFGIIALLIIGSIVTGILSSRLDRGNTIEQDGETLGVEQNIITEESQDVRITYDKDIFKTTRLEEDEIFSFNTARGKRFGVIESIYLYTIEAPGGLDPESLQETTRGLLEQQFPSATSVTSEGRKRTFMEREGFEIIYDVQNGIEDMYLQTVGVIIEGVAYLFMYNAEADDFEKNIDIVNTLIDSVEYVGE